MWCFCSFSPPLAATFALFQACPHAAGAPVALFAKKLLPGGCAAVPLHYMECRDCCSAALVSGTPVC